MMEEYKVLKIINNREVDKAKRSDDSASVHYAERHSRWDNWQTLKNLLNRDQFVRSRSYPGWWRTPSEVY
jgi:hypothetical protein